MRRIINLSYADVTKMTTVNDKKLPIFKNRTDKEEEHFIVNNKIIKKKRLKKIRLPCG